jgi:hypothetical protein
MNSLLISDTIIPSINAEDITDESVSEAFHGYYQGLGDFMKDDIATLRSTPAGQAFLARGAITTSTHVHAAKTLQAALLPGSQKELFLVFTLLQTSLGCLILTGFPAPFHQLSLVNRSTALRRLRDSYLQPLRAIFQTFRRLTTGLFLSYAERGMVLSIFIIACSTATLHTWRIIN